jgi:hypothetical protein
MHAFFGSLRLLIFFHFLSLWPSIWASSSTTAMSSSHSNQFITAPPELRYGIASIPPRLPKNFRGRSGIWACEACGKTKLLARGTFKWTCEQCQTVLYTVPEYECPLERARRFLKVKADEHRQQPVKKPDPNDDGAQN